VINWITTPQRPAQKINGIKLLCAFAGLYQSKQIAQILGKEIANKDNTLLSAEAVVTLHSVLGFDTNMKIYSPLAPVVLQALANMVKQGDFNSATIVVDELIGLVEEEPKFFKNYASELLNGILQQLKQKIGGEKYLNLLIELVVVMTESSPAVVKKVSAFVESFVPVCMEFMTNIEYAADKWDNSVSLVTTKKNSCSTLSELTLFIPTVR